MRQLRLRHSEQEQEEGFLWEVVVGGLGPGALVLPQGGRAG